MTGSRRSVAGSLLSASGALILVGIITAEALYPAAYSTRANEVSDLGWTRSPNPIIFQPSSAMFTGTMILTGTLIIIAAYHLHLGFGRLRATLPVLALGVFGSTTWAFQEFCQGRAKRWIIYPIVLCLVSFGGYLMRSEARLRVAAAAEPATRLD